VRLPGTPPVFVFTDREPFMSNADSTNGNHQPDDDRKEPKDRIDANPPYRAGKVVRFRKLLAELIARRIIAARRGPPDAGRPPKR
jgi:hypothetical protein